jgi:hypothetical protein
MRTNRVVTAVGIAVLSIVAGIASAGASVLPPLSIRVVLNVTTIATGHNIRGTAIITNSTSKVIVVQTWECDQWLYVGLANRHVKYQPTILLSGCAASIDLMPGANRLPITVSTKYQSCEVRGTPRCTKSGMPSLPVGRYHIAVITNGVPMISYKSGRLRVTLT